MSVPLNTSDFCYRARLVYGENLGVVDSAGSADALGQMTYAEVMQRCDGMIRALDRLGIKRGDRVAIISPNSAKMLISLYAVTGSGRILVPINFRLSRDAAQYILDDSDASVVLIDPSLVDRFGRMRVPREISLDGVQDVELFAPTDDPVDWPVLDETLPATLNYTSGTTAAPKGVILTHRSHWLNAVVVASAFGLTETDRYLHTLPLFHVNGWGLPLAAAALGVPQIIQAEVRGAAILSQVANHGVTVLAGAATVASTIEAAAEEHRGAGQPVPGEGATRMISGGAPTPPAVIERFERTTGWEMLHAYGLTETGPVLTVNRVAPTTNLSPHERAQRLGAAGAPLIGVRLRVSDEDEVLAQTAKAMDGYWGKPALSADAFEDTWVRTGDGGYLEKGVLHITDRKKDVIITGGENVSSLQVEACLVEHPDVSDTAVIAVPHERWGETPKAFVVLRDGASPDAAALVAFCRERLAHFQAPTSIEFVESLPRTATGKVQKYVLRERYWRQT